MSRKTKYTCEQKEKIVRACIEGEDSISRIARQYGISKGRIHEWIVQYKARGAAAFLPQRQNNVYDEGIKINAVKEYHRLSEITFYRIKFVLDKGSTS